MTRANRKSLKRGKPLRYKDEKQVPWHLSSVVVIRKKGIVGQYIKYTDKIFEKRDGEIIDISAYRSKND